MSVVGCLSRMDLAWPVLISLPDTLNFVANLLLLLPDVATCGQMFIILNSYGQLTEIITPVMSKSAGGAGVWML